jgi:hypothetical protein
VGRTTRSVRIAGLCSKASARSLASGGGRRRRAARRAGGTPATSEATARSLHDAARRPGTAREHAGPARRRH